MTMDLLIVPLDNKWVKNTIFENDIFSYGILPNHVTTPIDMVWYNPKKIVWQANVDYFDSVEKILTYFSHEFCHCFNFFVSKKKNKLLKNNFGFKNQFNLTDNMIQNEIDVLALQQVIIEKYTQKSELTEVPWQGLDGLEKRGSIRNRREFYFKSFYDRIAYYEKMDFGLIEKTFSDMFIWMKKNYE